MQRNETFPRRRLVLGIALLLAIASAARAEDAPPNRPLDAATMAALGISAPDATTDREVRPDAGAWSWNSGQYSYDGSGNITAIGTQSLVYDLNSRLVSATLTRPDQLGSQTHTYTYDSFGNMTSRTAVTTTIPTATAAATNHLTSLSAMYDAAGNLTQLQPPGQAHVYQYTYDPLNVLQQVKVSSLSGETRQLYIYTADDERIWTFDMGPNVNYWKLRDLDGKVLREFTATFPNGQEQWELTRDYIYRNGTLLAAVTPATTLHFSVDHLGTPRVITDSNRIRVGFHHYFPFGEEWTDNSGAQEGESLKFTGHERDRDPAGGTSMLDYMHARYYAAVLGRFLSVDPGQDWDPHQPQSWNLYAYVRNNPINNTDPSGMKMDCVTKEDGTEECTVIPDDSSPPAPPLPPPPPTIFENLWPEADRWLTDNVNRPLDRAYANFGSLGTGVSAEECHAAGLCQTLSEAMDMMAPMVGGQYNPAKAAMLGKKADDLIRGSLKASASYRAELGQKTYAEIIKLSQGSGPVAQAAKGMKKLIEQSERLLSKVRGK